MSPLQPLKLLGRMGSPMWKSPAPREVEIVDFTVMGPPAGELVNLDGEVAGEPVVKTIGHPEGGVAGHRSYDG
ncbi:hypothetical protein U1Q18_043416 [Sarracenia purpurea var. burkii]